MSDASTRRILGEWDEVRTRKIKAAAIIGVCAIATTASAGGFALKEGSAAAQGASFAGASSKDDDVSHSFWNPAAMSAAGPGLTIAVSGSAVLPDGPGVVSSNAFGGGVGNRINGAQSAFVPANYAAFRINDRLVLGAAITSPFGLTTDYDKGEFGVGSGANPARTGLIGAEIATMISYDVHPKLTIAGGPTLNVGELNFETNIQGGGALPAGQANSNLNAKAHQFGLKVGAVFRPIPTTTFGATYRTGYSLSAKGTLDNEGSAALLGASNLVPGSYDATFSADLPPRVTFGASHLTLDRFRIMVEGQWEGWSSLDRAAVDSAGIVGGATSETFGYKDAWLVALGGEYVVNQNLTFRSGVAWDDTPTTDQDRTARIVDEDRFWTSADFSYTLSDKVKIDFAYSYLFAVSDPTVLTTTSRSGGDFSGSAHIVTLGGTFGF